MSGSVLGKRSNVDQSIKPPRAKRASTKSIDKLLAMLRDTKCVLCQCYAPVLINNPGTCTHHDDRSCMQCRSAMALNQIVQPVEVDQRVTTTLRQMAESLCVEQGEGDVAICPLRHDYCIDRDASVIFRTTTIDVKSLVANNAAVYRLSQLAAVSRHAALAEFLLAYEADVGRVPAAPTCFRCTTPHCPLGPDHVFNNASVCIQHQVRCIHMDRIRTCPIRGCSHPIAINFTLAGGEFTDEIMVRVQRATADAWLAHIAQGRCTGRITTLVSEITIDSPVMEAVPDEFTDEDISSMFDEPPSPTGSTDSSYSD